MHHFIAIWPGTDTEPHNCRYLTPDSEGLIPLLTGGPVSMSLDDILPGPLISGLTETGVNSPATLLLLEPQLASCWHLHDWEGSSFAGQPARARLLAVRRAKVVFEVASKPGVSNARWLNLFPREQYDFERDLSPLVEQERLRPCFPRYLATCMGDVSDLFILGHGDTNGLIDQHGNPFELPETAALPKRIWLLACNKQGAMHALAQRLIDRGVRTVVVATGDLSAPQTTPIIQGWLSSHVADPAAWIAETQNSHLGEGGVRSLTVWGEVCVDPSNSASWNGLTWELKHGSHPRLPLDDETTREEFRAANDALDASDTWPLTREWMLPPLLWLAEKHEHLRMRELEVRLGDASSPVAMRGLAAAARRVGHYPQMARYLARSLAIEGLPERERAESLGGLANLLIDLDLPVGAAMVADEHEDCFLDDPQTRQLADFKRLDWRARIAARQGRPDIAIDLMTTKRRLASNDTGRELAWQTYLAAWAVMAGQVAPSVADAFALETRSRLAQTNVSTVGRGNETVSYLLRALASHAWASQDLASRDLVLAWLPMAESRLVDDDPGPLAYVIAYLFLCGVVDRAIHERAMSALERTRYYLEAAIFQGMAGNAPAHDRLLNRYQSRRNTTIEKLGDAGVMTHTDLLAEVHVRTLAECAAGTSSIDAAAARGVIPL